MGINVHPSTRDTSVSVKTQEVSNVHWPAYSAGEVNDTLSSTSALDNGNTYTSDWVQCDQYESLVISVTTDQNGTFTVQYSPDGVNVDSMLTRYYRTNQFNVPHVFKNARKYCRVTFTNDSGSNQTYLRLQVILGTRGPLNIPVDATMAQDYDAQAVRPTDFHTEVALGRRQGATTWNKFGYNDNIDTATDPSIVAEFGGGVAGFNYLTAGETMTIVSASTADDVGSTGATQTIVWGVDENWDEQIEVVSMDGTTPVVTTSQWIGINRISVYTAGSGKKNAGKITATATSSGYTLATMPAGEGTTQQMLFYVPVSHQYLASWLYWNVGKVGGASPQVTIKGLVYSDIAGAEYEIYRDTIDSADNQHMEVSPPVPFVVGEKSILWFTAETDTSNTLIRGRMSGELFRDPDG